MKRIISEELMQRVIDLLGVSSQFEMLHEECLELALAIHHYRRKGKGTKEEKMYKIIDEIADVKLVLSQIEFILNEKDRDLLNERIEYKKNRLIKRLDEYENENDPKN